MTGATSGNSTVVKKRGRPSSPDSLVFITVGLTPVQWQWLSLWLPGASPTSQLSMLFERALKFWPSGPAAFGHVRKTGGEL